MPRKETIDKIPMIKKCLELYKEGKMTITQIKIDCECGAALIKRVEGGEFDDPHDPQKLGSLTPPKPPPRAIKHDDPQIRGSYEDHRNKLKYDDMEYNIPQKDIWKEAEKKHKSKIVPIKRVEFKSANDFIVWVNTLNPDDYVFNDLSALNRIQAHKRPGLIYGTLSLYQKFCKLPPVEQEMMNELKVVLEKRKNGVK